MAFLRVVHALLLVLAQLLVKGNGYNLDVSHPIVYRVPDESEGRYFGMSVALRPRAATFNDSWTIQIGAPRGSGGGKGVREPGSVYRCHSYGPCRRFPVDEGIGDSGGYGVTAYKEKKDGAWIGVAMDIIDSGGYERSVVCGHRWMNQNLKNPENIDVTYLMTGICYLQDLFNETFETPVQRLLPLVNRDKIYTPKPYVVDLSTYHWGLGQAGLSVKLTTDPPSDLLIGAPGVTHWIGSLIRYDRTLRPTVGHFATSEIARKNRYTYLGYAVTSGRFYKDRGLYYVAGAPRSANYHGEIFTFRLEGSSGNVRLESNLAGSTFGEYFGASLAVADLNGDSFDDLVVGAPLFSSKGPDEGRIYAYLGTGRGNFLVPAQVINGHAGGGRFGSCVTPLKDLDRDGYNDMAVGAPYEDGRGAVYIYRGFAKGLQPKHSQRISARDVSPFLRGFGVSISRAVDVDGNKYEDIAVGSYLSGHVVLIRSRPVISLHVDIKTKNITLIDRRDSHINVSVCSRYAGSDAPEHVDIVRILQVDPVHGRGTLDPKSSASKTIRLRRNQINCELHSIMLNISDKNYSPLQIAVKSELTPCMDSKKTILTIQGRETKGRDEFSKTCPLGNRADHTTEIGFAGVCGPDLTCRSDLDLSCGLPNSPGGTYVVGSSDPILLYVKVQNRGEPAYHTRIKIFSDFKLEQRDHKHDTPQDTPRKTFWSDVEGLLTDTYQTNFSFLIDPDVLDHLDRPPRLNLIVEIFTSSLEANLNNNKCKLSLELTSHAHLDFYASSSLSALYLPRSGPRQTLINVTHYYEVQKTGVTPLKDVQIAIHVPFYFKKEFLRFETETAEWMHSSDGTDAPASRAIAPGGSPNDPALCDPQGSPPTNRTLFLNCSTPETACRVVNIFFGGVVPPGLSSYVKIIMTLNVTAIDISDDEKDIVHVSTVGVLRSWKLFEEKPNEVRKSLSLSIYEEKPERQVDGRVVGLSLLAGGLLLVLIVTGLVKKNFFKRAKKQELEALRDADASFVYFATQDVVGENDPDCV